MDVRRAYCSAVDRNVPVVLRAGAEPRDRVTLKDASDLVCLDYKVRCTGWCCPLFSVEDDAELRGDASALPVAAMDAAASRRPPQPRKRWNRPT